MVLIKAKGKTKGLKRKPNRQIKVSEIEKPRKARKNEEISSDEDRDIDISSVSEEESESEAEETVEQKKQRLTKEYFSKIRAAEEEEEEEEEEENDEDSKSLLSEKSEKREFKKSKEKLDNNREVAKLLKIPEIGIQKRTLHLPCSKCVADMAVTSDERKVYVVDKKGSLFLLDLETKQKSKFKFERNFTELLTTKGTDPEWVRWRKNGFNVSCLVSVAVSHDDKHVIAAGGDKHIHVFDVKSQKLIKSFPGHREAITGLAFLGDSSDFFSCSFDRTVKHWSLDDLSYVNTLYGHQSEVLAIDSLWPKNLVTSGSDRTCRVWKVESESQLVFRAPSLAVDCIRFLTYDVLVSGSSDGLQLWNIKKKKPLCIVKDAHDGTQKDKFEKFTGGALEMATVQSIATCRGADLIASGAGDGFVKLWQANRDSEQRINSLSKIGLKLSARGFINSLYINNKGNMVIAAVSQEPRLGKWARDKGAKCGISVFKLEQKFDKL